MCTAANIAGLPVRHTILAHSRQWPCIHHEAHSRRCPRLRHGPHSRQRLCLSHDPKSLIAASTKESSTQERNVNIRRASRENGVARRDFMCGSTTSAAWRYSLRIAAAEKIRACFCYCCGDLWKIVHIVHMNSMIEASRYWDLTAPRTASARPRSLIDGITSPQLSYGVSNWRAASGRRS
jgi:hypothetical protein